MVKKKNILLKTVIIGVVLCGILGGAGYYLYNQFSSSVNVGDEIELNEAELQELMERDDVEVEMVD